MEKTENNFQKELGIGSNLSVSVLLTQKYRFPLDLDKVDARGNNQLGDYLL